VLTGYRLSPGKTAGRVRHSGGGGQGLKTGQDLHDDWMPVSAGMMANKLNQLIERI
jgi:hypothetical protein